MEQKKRKFKVVRKILGPEEYAIAEADRPRTMEEEVVYLVKEWYLSRGIPVPPEDLEACKGIDTARDLEYGLLMEAASTKPVYGTPEFWKDWWAKKKAKDPNATDTKTGKGPKSAKQTLQA